MTLKDFQGMPGLIPRKEFMRVTGLDAKIVRELVASGEVKVFRRGAESAEKKGRRGQREKTGQRRGVYARYYTVEAARLCGFDLSQ